MHNAIEVENLTKVYGKGQRQTQPVLAVDHINPALLFMDEPTPGLNAQGGRTIRELIRQLNSEGTTIFLTTHQIEEANQLCDRVAIINHGQIAAIDTPERMKHAFQRMQSVQVSWEPDGRVHGDAMAAMPGVSTSVKMGDKWRLGTYDRLLAAPMSLLTLLLGKTAVGALFAICTSAFALLVGVMVYGVKVAQPWLLAAGVILGAFSFSALGLIFRSIPTRNPGEVQMPSTLLRWGLLFISGIFIPLVDMGAVARTLAYISPLTYAQDLMNHGVLGQGLLNPWLDLAVLLASGIIFLLPSIWMHNKSRKLGF